MKPDDVCANYTGAKKIHIRVDDDIVVIEGEAEALEFIGNLFLAQARFERDCGFQICPTGGGNAFFTRESTHGLYIHRLPCDE